MTIEELFFSWSGEKKEIPRTQKEIQFLSLANEDDRPYFCLPRSFELMKDDLDNQSETKIREEFSYLMTMFIV